MSIFKKKTIKSICDFHRTKRVTMSPPPTERDKVLGAIEVLNKCDVEYSIYYDGYTYVRNGQTVRCTATADDINELRKQFERLRDGE